ncbi:MAG: hypothetical protein ACI9XR_000825 [Flavobacterium sp.]|jgi:hypothetical protein
MKKIFLFIIFFIIFWNCSSINQSKTSLNKAEISLLNSFLKQELNRVVYTRNIYDSIIIIKDATPKKQIIEDYESFSIKSSLFDSLTFLKIKKELSKETNYYFKSSDFVDKRIILKTKEEFRTSIQNHEFFKKSKELVFYLSTPYFIDKNTALITVVSGSGELGFRLIDSGVILMKKNKQNKWVAESNLGSRYY